MHEGTSDEDRAFGPARAGYPWDSRLRWGPAIESDEKGNARSNGRVEAGEQRHKRRGSGSKGCRDGHVNCPSVVGRPASGGPPADPRQKTLGMSAITNNKTRCRVRGGVARAEVGGRSPTRQAIEWAQASVNAIAI